jgi:hypothetical protein
MSKTASIAKWRNLRRFDARQSTISGPSWTSCHISTTARGISQHLNGLSTTSLIDDDFEGEIVIPAKVRQMVYLCRVL